MHERIASHVSATTVARRNDLDWLRIIAFGVLIFYHVGVFYCSGHWHANSIHSGPAVDPLLRITSPWRLLLLFVISGVATRFMLDKTSTGPFLVSRCVRLLVPLAFGAAVIVAPQTYIHLTRDLGDIGSYADFYGKYLTNTGEWVIHGQPLFTPQWSHLWFVAYLFAFTLLVVVIGPWLKRVPARWAAPLVRWPLVLILPLAFLTVMQQFALPYFLPELRYFIDDWYYFGVFLSAVLFGYAIAKHEAFFELCERLRWPMLVSAVAAYLIPEIYRLSGDATLSWGQLNAATNVLRALQAWAMVLALFGFARKHLRRDGPMRRYLTDAIFPYYIIHQTTIVVAGHYLTALALPPWVEAPLLIAVTVASCIVGYEIVRRVGFLRPLFGLKPLPRTKATASQTVRPPPADLMENRG